MAAGAIGTNGANVRARAAAVCRSRVVNATIRYRKMVDRFVSANGFATKYAIINCVPRMSPAFGRSNAQSSTTKRIGGKRTIGCHTLIVVSAASETETN